MYMYQVGVPANKMRISQFFSIDTIGSLVKMCEFYPNLYDKICKREPNAYMAMLYFDTELFRRQKKSTQAKSDEEIDYKAKFYEMMKEDWRFESKSMQMVKKQIDRLLLKYGQFIEQKDYKQFNQVIIAGDPKRRTLRSLEINLYSKVSRWR